MPSPPSLADVTPVPHGRTAQRLLWQHLPPALRSYVERRLGSPVVAAESMGAGFTPGFASRLTGADGSRTFVKAANRVAQQEIAESYLEEARKLAVLVAWAPGLPMPRPLWSHVDEAWVVLAFECVEGRNPRRPWRAPELTSCLACLVEVAELTQDPPASLRLRPIHEDVPGLLTGWTHVATARPDWPHLTEAAALAASYADLPDADRFVHSDGRDDNLLLVGAANRSRALLCDWNWPALGPVWLDAVDLMVSAHGDGLDADRLLTECPLTAEVDADRIDAWLAALTGFMLESGDRPERPASPWLRTHARWYAAATWSWLAHRRGWA